MRQPTRSLFGSVRTACQCATLRSGTKGTLDELLSLDYNMLDTLDTRQYRVP